MALPSFQTSASFRSKLRLTQNSGDSANGLGVDVAFSAPPAYSVVQKIISAFQKPLLSVSVCAGGLEGALPACDIPAQLSRGHVPRPCEQSSPSSRFDCNSYKHFNRLWSIEQDIHFLPWMQREMHAVDGCFITGSTRCHTATLCSG